MKGKNKLDISWVQMFPSALCYHTKYIYFRCNSSNYYHYKYIQGKIFRPYRTIIRSYYKNNFSYFQYILGSQIVYIDVIVVTMLYAIIYIKVKTDIKIEFCLRYCVN